MCPLVVESSISSAPLQLAVNDGHNHISWNSLPPRGIMFLYFTSKHSSLHTYTHAHVYILHVDIVLA